MSSSAASRGRAIAALLGAAIANRPDRLPDASLVGQIEASLLRAGAGPLTWWTLRTAPDPYRSNRGRLHGSYLSAVSQSLVADLELARLWRELSANRVHAVLAKGRSVARVYPEPALRPFGDFDVYAPIEELAAAKEAVDRAGLKRFTVDLHGGASHLDDIDFAVLYAASAEFSIGGSDLVRSFSPAHELRLVCLHALSEGAMRPLWLYDVALFTRHRLAEIDWTLFFAGDPWRAHWASLAVRLAYKMFDLDVAELPRQIVRADLPPWMAPSVLKTWGRAMTVKGERQPFAAHRGAPGAMARALLARWPVPLEAVSGLRSRVPRRFVLGHQVLECARRASRYFSR